MQLHFKRLPVQFCTLSSGAEPVRDWLLTFSKEERARIGEALSIIEFGWPIGMPTCRPMGGGLFRIPRGAMGRRWKPPGRCPGVSAGSGFGGPAQNAT